MVAPAGLDVLGPLLEHVRRLNVEALRAALAAAPGAFVEPAFVDEDDTVALEGPYELPCRADGFKRRKNGAQGAQIRVDPATRLHFEPIRGRAGAADFVIHSFGWDYAHVSAALAIESGIEPVCEWFMRWFDADDENEPDADGLRRVVHFLSDPEFEDGRVAFTVDFGSAPVAALLDLVATLEGLGARDIEVA